MRTLIFTLILSLCLLFQARASDLVEHIQSVTYIIESPTGISSGVLIKDGTNHFILTVGHAVVHKGEPESPIFVGQVISGVSDDFILSLYISGLFEVVAYSKKIDVALLKEKTPLNFKHDGITLYDESTKPNIGTELWHCGNFNGIRGFRAVTRGIYSKYNVPSLSDNNRYDIGDYSAAKGCSGGGVWIEDGRLVGLTCQVFRNNNMALFLPSNKIVKWLKEEGYEELINDNESEDKIPQEEISQESD